MSENPCANYGWHSFHLVVWCTLGVVTQPTIRHEIRLCLYEKHKTEGALPRSEAWFPAAIFSVLEAFVDCFRFGSPTVSGPVPVASVCSEAHSSIADVFEPILVIPRLSPHPILFLVLLFSST